MGNFKEFIQNKIIPIFTNISYAWIIALVLIFISLIMLFQLLSKHNAFKISLTFALYTIIVSCLCILLDVSKVIYVILIVAFVISIICIFSIEIKRSVWNTKSSKAVSSSVERTVKESSAVINNCINEIIKAVQNMSKNDVGAIIVLSNTKIPNSILDSGVKLDSSISSALIESVFFPKTPLHDGAIIIQNDTVLAAGCFLPLSQETDLPKELGTRHRAGIGITEILNVTAIIVSEETGIISYARGGKITRYVDTAGLRNLLKEYYWQDILASTKGGKNERI